MKKVIEDNKVKKSPLKAIGFHVKNLFLFILLYLLNGLSSLIVIGPPMLFETMSLSKGMAIPVSMIGFSLLILLSYGIARHYHLVNLKNIFTKKNITIIIVGFLVMQLIGFISIFYKEGRLKQGQICICLS